VFLLIFKSPRKFGAFSGCSLLLRAQQSALIRLMVAVSSLPLFPLSLSLSLSLLRAPIAFLVASMTGSQPQVTTDF